MRDKKSNNINGKYELIKSKQGKKPFFIVCIFLLICLIKNISIHHNLY